ncbi:MAG: phosphatase PAP2 family protein [Bacillota bacterium]|nr:phosphatase PAP2 family protein [Bacillota bacterium]
MNAFDLNGFHVFNQWAGHMPIVDGLMSFVAQYALELYAVLFLIAWFTLPKPESDRRHALIIMGLSGVLSLCLNVIIGHLWLRPRPFVFLSKGTFTQLIPHAVDASFPSDHVAGSFGFAAGSWRKANLWVIRSFTSLAVLVAVARVYVGVHWPTDVIAGAFVGLFSAKIMWSINGMFRPLTNVALRIFNYGGQLKATR